MKTFTYTLAFATWALLSCDSKPKVIVADTKTESPANSAIPNSTVPVAAKNPMGDMHQVQVTEVLQAERRKGRPRRTPRRSASLSARQPRALPDACWRSVLNRE